MANSRSYNTPIAAGLNVPGTPKPSAKISDENGFISRDWWRYLSILGGAPSSQEFPVTVGTSPTTYTATGFDGHLLITGGTVSSITITRRSTYNTGLTTGFIPLSIGDQANITYTALPTLTWIPH